MTAARRSGTKSQKRGPYAPDVTRTRILDAALSLFSEVGFNGTAVDAIVGRAKITKGAFYHHFETKEDVLREIHAEYAIQALTGARDIAADGELEPLEQLRQLIERSVIVLGSYHDHVAVYYQEFRFIARPQYSAIRRMKDEYEEIFLGIVEKAKAKKQIRKDVDSSMVLHAASGVTAWTYQWYRPDGELSLDRIAKQMSGIVLNGVVPAVTGQPAKDATARANSRTVAVPGRSRATAPAKRPARKSTTR
jgi:TetR/AcrR family transcriptional regulator, cholesterol catabolism regulator